MDSINIMDEIDALMQETSNLVEVNATEESLPAKDIIRPNSPTLLVDESTSRFSGAIWAQKIAEKNIILAGLGGIGRFGNLKYFYYLCA